MTIIDDKIRDEKLQYHILALSSGKIDKYEYVRGEEKQLKSKEKTKH